MSTIETPTLPELLTVADAAEWLGVTRATVYRWVNAGVIPAIRVGGTLRIDRSELLKHVYSEEH